MSQFYIGVQQVMAYPERCESTDGYHIVGRHGTAEVHHFWLPKEEFERTYLPMGVGEDGARITQAMVDAALHEERIATVGKTTICHHTLRIGGFEMVESAACVDPANYDEKVGTGICRERISNRLWQLLGFVLQWGRSGLTTSSHKLKETQQ